MPLCTYAGEDDRYYPSLGVNATPGLVVDLPELPDDGRWSETPGSAPTVNAFVPEPLEG
jgi:hypothetical protein